MGTTIQSTSLSGGVHSPVGSSFFRQLLDSLRHLGKLCVEIREASFDFNRIDRVSRMLESVELLGEGVNRDGENLQTMCTGDRYPRKSDGAFLGTDVFAYSVETALRSVRAESSASPKS